MHEAIAFSQALADFTRWRIVLLVHTEALCVCELAEILDMPQSSVSSHIQVIRKAGLLENERCEKWIYYRLSPGFLPLINSIREKFRLTSSYNANLALDEKRMHKRLAKREMSCCPGPKFLSSSPPIEAQV